MRVASQTMFDGMQGSASALHCDLMQEQQSGVLGGACASLGAGTLSAPVPVSELPTTIAR